MSVPHLKPITCFKVSRFDVDALDASCGWALAQTIDELLDGNFVALEMRLDAAVGSIANPADDS